MQRLISIIFFLLSTFSFAQITYEKGYLINGKGEKLNCLIKDAEWNNNPEYFQYKASEKSEPVTGLMQNVKEFGVNGRWKYRKFLVDIDRSSDNLNMISSEKAPEFSEEELFLKVLVEGKANLYVYRDGNMTRYFYSVDEGDVRQLVSKIYKSTRNKVKANNAYKQDLWNKLNYPILIFKRVENLNYRERDLTSFFLDYNEYHDSSTTYYQKRVKRDVINVSVKLGVRSSTLNIENGFIEPDPLEFDKKLTVSFGMEAEFVLPFNKNKWAILIEPTYKYYNSEGVSEEEELTVNYSSIELPFGLRHYLFLNENSKLFFNGLFVLDFSFNSAIRRNNSNYLDLQSRGGLAMGIGLANRNFNLELRYGLSRNILDNYTFWDSDYSSISLLLGYRLF